MYGTVFPKLIIIVFRKRPGKGSEKSGKDLEQSGRSLVTVWGMSRRSSGGE